MPMIKKTTLNGQTLRKNRNDVLFPVMIAAVAFAISIITAVSSVYFKEDYDIKVNAVSPKTFRATQDIVNDVATDKLRVAAADSVAPLYYRDQTVNEKVTNKLTDFFNTVGIIRMKQNPIVNPADFYDSSGDTTEGVNGGGNNNESNTGVQSVVEVENLPIPISEEQLSILIDMGTEAYNEFTSSVQNITESALGAGIKKESEGLTKSLASVRDAFNGKDWENSTKNLGVQIVTNILEVNEFIDEGQTNKLREEKAGEVEPIVYLLGQNIVSAGDIVTDEIYAALDKLGFIKKSSLENILPMTGAISVATLIFFVSILYIYFFNTKMIYAKKSLLLLFAMYSSGIVLSRLLYFAPFPLIPILAICMLTSLLLDERLAIIMSLCVSVNAAAANGADIKFVMYFLITGIFVSVIGKYTADRNKIFVIGLFVSLFNVLAVSAVYLLADKNYSEEMQNMVVYAALSGVLTVIVSVGSLPFWEAAFGVVTSIKMLELANPNNELLRRLIIEAPGTYHHSLIVANLSETGAYDIGANSTLARVGGYYHDIGKLKYPQYFAENQLSDNPHAYMDPYSSAQVIAGHIATGLELAEQNKLPKVVRDFIEQHHGSTLIKYFYFKAKNDNPDTDIKESDFRYPCPKPASREAAVVMLADTVEAAVRSMIPTGKSMGEVEVFVRSLIKDKLDDGQLINSNLTINDLETLANSFMRVFKGMYHERIPYPKSSTKELTAKPSGSA